MVKKDDLSALLDTLEKSFGEAYNAMAVAASYDPGSAKWHTEIERAKRHEQKFLVTLEKARLRVAEA